MKYDVFIKELSKIFEKNQLNEKIKLSDLNFDSLKILEILSFADKNFKNLSLNVDKLYNCKNIKDLINLFKIKK